MITTADVDIRATDLTKLTVNELKSLTVNVQTDFMNGYLENEIIVTDVFTQIISELAERREK